MTPVQKLIKIIDPQLSYLIYDLVEKCLDCGINMDYHRLHKAISTLKLKTTQPGGWNCQHEIAGQDFIDYFLDRVSKT